MTPEHIAREHDALKSWINMVHGPKSDEALTRQAFLRESWDGIASLVHWNKQHPLVQESVRQHPDLIPRGFAILTMLYGVYTYEPTKRAVLNDFVTLLGNEPIEEELKVMEYAKTQRMGSFFNELSKIMLFIGKIYRAPHFELALLPPTPHQAYALFVLNHGDLLHKNISAEELFGHLSVNYSMMKKIFTLAEPANKGR
jgi:hypothetical protein